MKNVNLLLKSFILIAFILSGGSIWAQSTVSGTVTDESGESLIGANVIIAGTTEGTITDFDGTFSISTNRSFPLSLVVSFTGYNTLEVPVNAPSANLRIALAEGVLIGGDIVISASRKREKIQEAPASITVLSARKLEGSPQAEAIRNLINVPGVQIQQQSAARMNIEMRASSGIFGTSVFPIKDYRSLIGPGIGTFQSDQSGLSTLDLNRIEVVRGPGSALYGPGVTSGVVHFITKNPIDYPGTAIELMGGELNTFGASIRHAGAKKDKTFGYKVNFSYKQGDEFSLDQSNAADALQIAKFKKTIVQPIITNDQVDLTKPGTVLLTQAQLDPDGDGNMMQDDWWNMGTDLTFEFRPKDNTSITVAGGMNQASAVFYNDLGEGLSQAREYWGQARAQIGGLFAQVFYVSNDGGAEDRPTFLYQTGNRSPVGRKQVEGQVQYNFGVPNFLNADFTVGTDYRKAISESLHMVYGRNEDTDDYDLYGGYIQGKFALSPKFDLVLAGRYDVFKFLDNEGAFAPRAALVYKASPKHSFRASYNRASSPPSALELNIDFPVNAPVPGLFDFWLYGQKGGHTFPANPTIDVSIPGVPDLPYGTPGFPLAIAYGAVTPAIISSIQAAVGTLLTQDQFVLLRQLLTSAANTPTGFSGQLVGVNAFDGTLLSTLVGTNPPTISTTSTIEFGYKGLIADKLGVTIDIYNNKRKGGSDFTQIGPMIQLVGQNIAADLGKAVQDKIQPQIQAILQSLGLPAATAAAQAAGFGALLNQAYAAGGAQFVAATSPLYPIFGAVESNEVPKGDGIVHVPAGYRIFTDTEFSYWGSDIALEYFVSDDLSIFGNYSWLSKTDFPASESGEPVDVYLNAPKNKFRLGMNFTPNKGIRANLAFQHDDSFFGNLGQFTGPTDEKNLVDAGVGYNFGNGLAVDLTANNLFDSEYRAFVNMPKIGRRVLAKLTYTFGR